MKTTEKPKFNNIKTIVLSLFVVVSLFLTGCSSDDGGSGGSSKNYVILDGKRYNMNRSAYYTEFDVADRKWVTLSVDNDHTARRHFNITFGEKNFAELNSGTYIFKEWPYPNNAGVYNPNQNFAGSDFTYNCSGMTIESCDEAVLTSGTVTITKSGNNITIDLEGMTDKGAVEAHYEGSITDFLNVEF